MKLTVQNIFPILSSPLNRIFFAIWKFVLEFAYVILSILVFFRIVEKRYFQKEKIISKENEKENKTIKNS